MDCGEGAVMVTALPFVSVSDCEAAGWETLHGRGDPHLLPAPGHEGHPAG